MACSNGCAAASQLLHDEAFRFFVRSRFVRGWTPQMGEARADGNADVNDCRGRAEDASPIWSCGAGGLGQVKQQIFTLTYRPYIHLLFNCRSSRRRVSLTTILPSALECCSLSRAGTRMEWMTGATCKRQANCPPPRRPE